MSLTTTTDVQTEGSKEVHVWKCTAADCNAWIKDEYVTEASPSCPLCKSAMERDLREIPVAVKKFRKTFIVGKRRF